jgi:hypothetical protein
VPLRPPWDDADYRGYAGDEEALADLSRACVAHGRAAAGLPPLAAG